MQSTFFRKGTKYVTINGWRWLGSLFVQKSIHHVKQTLRKRTTCGKYRAINCILSETNVTMRDGKRRWIVNSEHQWAIHQSIGGANKQTWRRHGEDDTTVQRYFSKHLRRLHGTKSLTEVKQSATWRGDEHDQPERRRNMVTSSTWFKNWLGGKSSTISKPGKVLYIHCQSDRRMSNTSSAPSVVVVVVVGGRLRSSLVKMENQRQKPKSRKQQLPYQPGQEVERRSRMIWNASHRRARRGGRSTVVAAAASGTTERTTVPTDPLQVRGQRRN